MHSHECPCTSAHCPVHSGVDHIVFYCPALCSGRLHVSNPSLKCWILFCLQNLSVLQKHAHTPSAFHGWGFAAWKRNSQEVVLSMEWHGEGWKLLFIVPSNTRTRGARWSQKIAGWNELEGSHAHSVEGRENPFQHVLEVLKGCMGLKSNGAHMWQKNPTRTPSYKHTSWEFEARRSS